ncbi:hypothetical protein [Salinispora arenicola]|uniref:hypothetical protein n=1 Tax=Salinispora arenicola TaxID=168697 RepID=UPI0027DB8E7C|nr:hypothetical protein [Salinispora arenicola]
MTGQQPGDAGEPGIVPAENPTPTRQSVTYIILTALRPDSGLILGSVRAVAHAEISRRLGGPGSRDALVAAYVSGWPTNWCRSTWRPSSYPLSMGWPDTRFVRGWDSN